ncbi:Os06g0731100, partial [Oryza sativa Japonica Group]
TEQGYFQALFGCIERLLASLKVKHFVLPAADEAESIWTQRFGFVKITQDELREYLKGGRTTVFQGTSTLHKLVPKLDG